MSDMANAYYNAFVDVFQAVENRLYCHWHVLKAWRENLTKISVAEKRITGNFYEKFYFYL